MTGRRWIFLTFATVLAFIGLSGAVAYVADPYGLLRDPTGRKLLVFASERKVKFLMNKRYVPTNFDGLLVGTSSSANWDLSSLDGVNVFNESLEGGDAAEGRFLVDEAMAKGHYKLAVLVLSHAMTKESSIKDGLDSVDISAAIGSLFLFSDEMRVAMMHAHRTFSRSDTVPNGQIELLYPKNLEPMRLPASQLRVNPKAVEEYRAMVNTLSNAGTKIIYVIPPMYEPCYKVNKAGYDAHLQTVRDLLPPAPLVDFDGPEYLEFRSDPANYLDCFHLEPQGAAKIAAFLRQSIPAAVGPFTSNSSH